MVSKEPLVFKNFYLTGGTVLSSWYLHHRESYDLDFFTEKSFDYDQITNLLKTKQKEIGFRWIGVDEGWQFYTYYFRFPDNRRLKVDFGKYASSRLQRGLIWKGLEIDSLYDIAVNKTQMFMLKPRERDYLDLYFILQNANWGINKLLADASVKFEIDYNSVQVVKNFLKAKEITDFPKMLVPFDQKEMEKFYIDLAKSLKGEIFIK
ncbi:nucleotidyl transferase AbiEii/AbiGii toxin family protein [Candidatus Gottesmanbacteria bacterium]|nr:nucleotidyl transferase AbiEii/AbiGii toxin family protein [Candidatus Gottesmanbacteria bacterium]